MKRTALAASARALATLGALLTVTCVISPGFAHASLDVAQTSAGFMLSKNFVGIDGTSESWIVNLYPDGHLAFRGTHLPSGPTCSSSAGHFESTIAPEEHGALVELAKSAAEEQKGQKPANRVEQDPNDPHATAFNLSVELGEKSYLARIVNPEAPKTKAFLSEARRAYTGVLESPFQALSMSAKLGKDHRTVTVTVKNIGQIPTDFLTPPDADDAFVIVEGTKRSGLDWVRQPQHTSVKIPAGGSVTYLLKALKKVPADGVVLYDNRTILHHAEFGSKPLKVNLCSAVASAKGGRK